MNHKEKWRDLWLTIVIVIFTVIIIIVDFNTPRGIAIGILYVAPVFLSLWLSQHRLTIVIGAVSSLLVIIGFLYSPPSPSPLIFTMVNRGLSILAIALLVIVSTYSRAADYFSLVLQKRTADQALREAEERYRSLVRLGGETGEAIIMMQDMGEKEGVHIFCNKIWVQLTSYSEEELLKMSFFDLIHTDNRQEYLEVYRRKMREGDGANLYEMSIVGKYGDIVPVELTCGRTNYRRRPANVAYIRNVTERKRAERAVRESEERYRTLVQLGTAVGESIVVLQDTEQGEGIQTFVSDPWLVITGYTRDELLDKSFFEMVSPGDRTASIERYRKKLSGQAMPGLFELNIVRKDGSEVPIELTSAHSVYDGKKANVVYIRDITERKYAEETLRKSEQKYRTLVENIPQKIFYKDTNSVYVSCNVNYAQDLKMQPSEITGKTDYDFYPKELAERYRADNRRIIESGRQDEIDEEYIQYGQKRVVHTVKTPVKDEKGTVAGVLGIFWDITEQKQMQEKLIITDRLASVGQLAAGIMHEINNPLSSVVGFTELLMSRKDLPAGAKDDLNIINGEAQHIVQIAKGILTFARQQKPEKEPADIHIIIQRVLQLRAHEHKVNNIAVDIRFAPDLPRVMGNVGQLQQVFLNLIANAEQAMFAAHKRGTLTISSERLGDVVKVCFADDGPGISIENMGKLFTPFFTTKEAGKGTGLGLSICHGIVTEHGGNIYAESEPGKGATFIVELPISK